MYIHRSKILTNFLRNTMRWHPVQCVAEKMSVTPEQVVAVIASDEGGRYHCEVWGGKPWVRANDRSTRQALRGAVSPPTDILPGA